MRRITRTLATSFALLLSAAGATATAHAGAGSYARGAERIAVHLVNKGDDAQAIKVDGHLYAIQAPRWTAGQSSRSGAVVYAAGASARYHDGDKLLSITPDMKDKIHLLQLRRLPGGWIIISGCRLPLMLSPSAT